MVTEEICKTPAINRDFVALCDTAMIQRVITPLLFNVPNWSERATQFALQQAAEFDRIRQLPEIDPGEWLHDLLKLVGDSDPPEDRESMLQRLEVIAQSRVGLRRSPEEYLRYMSDLEEFCVPRKYSEWYQFAHHFFADPEARTCLMQVTETVVVALAASIEAGRVDFDIRAMAWNRPDEAFARCMAWHTEFLAWTRLAWPTPDEVHVFCAMSNGNSELLTQEQNTAAAAMLLNDPFYIGKRTTRVNRKHPFTTLMQQPSYPHINCELQLEINNAGELIGLYLPLLDTFKSEFLVHTSSRIDLTIQHPEVAKSRLIISLGLQLNDETQTLRRTGGQYSHIQPIHLSAAQWALFQELLKGGEDGVTLKYLSKVLKISKQAISTRRTALNEKLIPLDLKIPINQFCIVDVNANRG